jgi:hypothetical protein
MKALTDLPLSAAAATTRSLSSSGSLSEVTGMTKILAKIDGITTVIPPVVDVKRVTTQQNMNHAGIYDGVNA